MIGSDRLIPPGLQGADRREIRSGRRRENLQAEISDRLPQTAVEVDRRSPAEPRKSKVDHRPASLRVILRQGQIADGRLGTGHAEYSLGDVPDGPFAGVAEVARTDAILVALHEQLQATDKIVHETE